MNYGCRLFLYLMNQLLILLSLAGILLSLVMLALNNERWLAWSGSALLNIVLYLFFRFVFVLRKSKYPVPGIDYL